VVSPGGAAGSPARPPRGPPPAPRARPAGGRGSGTEGRRRAPPAARPGLAAAADGAPERRLPAAPARAGALRPRLRGPGHGRPGHRRRPALREPPRGGVRAHTPPAVPAARSTGSYSRCGGGPTKVPPNLALSVFQGRIFDLFSLSVVDNASRIRQ